MHNRVDIAQGESTESRTIDSDSNSNSVQGGEDGGTLTTQMSLLLSDATSRLSIVTQHIELADNSDQIRQT